MGGISFRSGNAGRAIIRFLIGLLILAIVVLLLYEVVLKGDFDMTKQPVDGAISLTITAGPTGFATSAATAPDVKENGAATIGEGAAMITALPTQEPTAKPTPEPTPEPTATPAPTAIPASAFSAGSKDATNAKWTFDLSKLDIGLTEFEIPATNAGKIIRLTGWAFAKDKNFDGTNCKVYIILMNAKGDILAYDAAFAPGAAGIEHTGDGKNLDECNYTAIVDISSYPDGEYQIGVGVEYASGNATRRYAYTYGDAYNFTVKSGVISVFKGIEQ